MPSTSRLCITVIDPSDGLPAVGVDVRLFYGSAALQGANDAEVGGAGNGAFTPTGDGAYYYDISDTDQYTVKIDGVVQAELTDVIFPSGDIVILGAAGTAGTLKSTQNGDSGADLVGVTAIDSYASTTAQSLLEELIGAPGAVITIAALDTAITAIEVKTDEVITADMTKLNDISATAAQINVLATVTATAAELNILDTCTATAAELNILDGCTATATQLNTIGDAPATGVTHFLENINSKIWSGLQVLDDILNDVYTRTMAGGGSPTALSGIVMVSHTVATENLQTTPAGEIYEFTNTDATLSAGDGVMSRIVSPSAPTLKNFIRVRFRHASELVIAQAINLYNPTLPATAEAGETLGSVKDTVSPAFSTTYSEYSMTYWWVGDANVHFRCWALELEVSNADSKSAFVNGITWQYWTTPADDYAQQQEEGHM